MTASDTPKVSHNIAVRVYEAQAQGRERQKILLLKFDHIGDFVTAVAAFRIIRQAFTEAEITLICLPSVVEVARRTGLFDIVKGFSGAQESVQLHKVPQMDDEGRIARFHELLDGPYFLAADFRHDPFDRFGLDHVEARYRGAFIAETEKGLDIVIPTMEWDMPVLQVRGGKNLAVASDTRMKLLAHAIVDTLIAKPFEDDLFPASEGPAYRALQNQTGMKIGVSIGAGSELRKWGQAYWAKLLARLIEVKNAHIVFFGGPGDRDETAELAGRLAPDAVTNLTDVIGLGDAPSYMKLLDGYIGCDTGLTHLAANLGVPTVDIFAGISNVSVWRARGPKVRTVYAEVICGPCHKRLKSDCPNNNVCMGEIVPEIVYACFEQVLLA